MSKATIKNKVDNVTVDISWDPAPVRHPLLDTLWKKVLRRDNDVVEYEHYDTEEAGK